MFAFNKKLSRGKAHHALVANLSFICSLTIKTWHIQLIHETLTLVD